MVLLKSRAVTTEAPEPALRVLRGRRILLISPQPWDHLHISKHHYAEELARENDVVFLEPPGPAGMPQVETRPHPTLARLQIASWSPFAPKLLRFHAYPVYRGLMASNAAWLSRRLGAPDVVWCFDFNVFPDLAAFGATVTIFHPVDPLASPRQIAIAETADILISVSERILANFSAMHERSRALLVNHGLSGPFAELARRPAPAREPGPIRCGCFGNLDRAIVNYDLLAATAQANPDVRFHFWGPYRFDGSFASKMLILPNVVAHGALDKSLLAREAAAMDLFILAYADHPTESDRSNAHKLLEYMSTGKAIVSTRMDCYTDHPDLLRMSRQPGDADFPALFSDTVTAIEAANAPGLVAKRKDFCRQFTYAANIARIDAVLARLSDRNPASVQAR